MVSYLAPWAARPQDVPKCLWRDYDGIDRARIQSHPQYTVTRQQSVIQTKVVLLIALLAISRKFIILDLKETTAESMYGLAVITLAIGIVYWLLRERDDRLPQIQAPRHPNNTSTDANKHTV